MNATARPRTLRPAWSPSLDAIAPFNDAAGQRRSKLAQIFEETANLSWRMLRRLGVPKQWMEDSFQRVFLTVSERLDDIVPGRERAFIYGVTLRVARTYVRMQGREMVGYDVDDEVTVQIDVDVQVDRTRLIGICDRILGQLAPELREVFILHEIEGQIGSEIAQLLGIPEGTVHSRLRRARIQVRSEVQALSLHSLGSTTLDA